MFKLMVDSSFIQALIFKNHPKHEVASRMAGTIDEEEYLYLPVYDLLKKWIIFAMKRHGNFLRASVLLPDTSR